MEKKSPILVVGLGNPDKEYLNTFHNTGFMCLDYIAEKYGCVFNKGECKAITSHILIDGQKVIFAKPITYMNLSGDAVIELINKYKIEKERFLVIYDDVDLPIGNIRVRNKGSAGTHNGMKDIVSKVNTQEINRIRIGIGQEYHGELADYVLSKITDNDKKLMQSAFEKGYDEFVKFLDCCKLN